MPLSLCIKGAVSLSLCIKGLVSLSPLVDSVYDRRQLVTRSAELLAFMLAFIDCMQQTTT